MIYEKNGGTLTNLNKKLLLPKKTYHEFGVYWLDLKNLGIEVQSPSLVVFELQKPFGVEEVTL